MVALVVTGTYDWHNHSQSIVEIIKENFETEVCNNIPEYPSIAEYLAASKWDDGKVTVCGGWIWYLRLSTTECYSLENGEWKLSNLRTGRSMHAASNVGNSVWITGNGIQMSQRFDSKSQSKFETFV